MGLANGTNPHPRKFIGDDIRRVIIIVASILALSGIIIVIAWLAIRPHKPNFAVNSLSLSNFNVSETHLKGDSNMLVITIMNTNKNAYLVIDNLDVYVYYQDTELSVATVNSPINMQSMSLIKMESELGVGGFSNSEVAGNPKYWKLLSPLLPDTPKLWIVGNDDFIVKMLVRVRFKILYQMITWRMNLDVHCSITYMRSFIAHDIWNVTGLGLCDVYSEH